MRFKPSWRPPVAEPEVRAQAVFTATLMFDGHLLISEGFAYRENPGDESLHVHEWHPVEGTCDPQELAYVLWSEMEAHI